MSKKVEDSLSKLEAAVARLGEALAEDSSNPLYLDATVQRFEFVFELAWKTLKRALDAEGLICRTPRETFKAAYQAGWIHEEELWLQMLDDRNVTSHTYDEPIAAEVYANIRNYSPPIAGAHGFSARETSRRIVREQLREQHFSNSQRNPSIRRSLPIIPPHPFSLSLTMSKLTQKTIEKNLRKALLEGGVFAHALFEYE